MFSLKAGCETRLIDSGIQMAAQQLSAKSFRAQPAKRQFSRKSTSTKNLVWDFLFT
jgi:hypothetical protein